MRKSVIRQLVAMRIMFVLFALVPAAAASPPCDGQYSNFYEKFLDVCDR